MSYNLDYQQWISKIEKPYIKTVPTPMRPVSERILYSTTHFVMMEANTTACSWRRRGKKLALIELAVADKHPTRIDPRLKSIRQIIVVREAINLRNDRAANMYKRWWQELRDLADKCERLYPCHFLIKGVGYERPKTFMDAEDVSQA